MATSTFKQVNSELADFLASSSFSEWERCNSLIIWRVHYLLHLKMNSLIFWRVHRPLAGKSWSRQIIDFGQFNRSLEFKCNPLYIFITTFTGFILMIKFIQQNLLLILLRYHSKKINIFKGCFVHFPVY